MSKPDEKLSVRTVAEKLRGLSHHHAGIHKHAQALAAAHYATPAASKPEVKKS